MVVEKTVNIKYVLPKEKVNKVNKITSASQNKARVNADNKTHYRTKGCGNDPNVANTPTQKIPDPTENNNAGNPAKDTDRVHKCPNCQETCKKLFNLRRHISRTCGDISIENKENETG